MSEYEKTPPLFPWESELREYPAEVADPVGVDYSVSLWNQHLSSLKVPGLLPEPVLNALFKQCQSIVLSPIKQGVQLVRAVESLFPAQGDMLEPIADIVLVPTYRSDNETQTAVFEQVNQLADDYASAKPEQQIALSMMAAKEILSAMTLSLSARSPEDSREWVTACGILKLSASYAGANPVDGNDTDKQLRVSAVLPDSGQIRLWDGNVEKRAACSKPGSLDLVWGSLTPAKTCLLEVSLHSEETSLRFVIKLEEPLESGFVGA
ncbi:MAG: hypothetical protein AAF716_12400 [Cyanobacteria bacterium P01_D01_bin.1]